MESQSVDQELAKIGREYIIEALGDDIINKKIYFVCLLCNPMNPKKETFPLLDAHLGSEEHQWKFLVSLWDASTGLTASYVLVGHAFPRNSRNHLVKQQEILQNNDS